MKYVVFDIETRNIFQDVGSYDPTALDISVLSAYESETDTMTSYLVEDLPKLWPILERADALVGYNSDHFDIPLLNKYYSGDLTTFRSIDIMATIKKHLGRRPKLDDVAAATLGAKKIAHGLEAVAWWKKGEIDKIIKYCEKDVELTDKLFRYIREHKHVKLKDLTGKKITIELDTTPWEAGENISVTHSLPF
jgi:DEAD/DEAH box helicase domain-containing protein